MSQQRGRQPARRNYNNRGGNGGMPGWAWLLIGALLAALLFIGVPRFMNKDSGGFFKPKPNPDAQPVGTSSDEAELTPDAQQQAATGKPASAAAAASDPSYSFYDMLPGDEVKLTDAQLAAMTRAEKQKADAAAAQAKKAATAPVDTALPNPIDSPAPAVASATSATPAVTPAIPAKETASKPAAPEKVKEVAKADIPVAAPVAATAATRYILQAGAFGQATQADELKAKVAMLGLNARVEEATINGKTMYRVRMGPYATAGELAAAKSKLGAGGLNAMPIKAK